MLHSQTIRSIAPAVYFVAWCQGELHQIWQEPWGGDPISEGGSGRSVDARERERESEREVSEEGEEAERSRDSEICYFFFVYVFFFFWRGVVEWRMGPSCYAKGVESGIWKLGDELVYC